MNVGIDEHRTKRKLKGKLTNENYLKNTLKKTKKENWVMKVFTYYMKHLAYLQHA